MALATVLWAVPTVAQDSLASDIDACAARPENRIGGAAIGECLLARSDEIDTDIEILADMVAARFCDPRHRQALQAAQAAWESYRDTECALVTDAPGNTPAYVNGASCRVELAYQRLDALRFVDTYARPRCSSYELVEDASMRGEPVTGQPVPIPGTQMSWQVEGSWGDYRLGLSGGPMQPLSCGFCEGAEDNCDADGIFIMQEADAPGRPILFAVCHVGAHSQGVTAFDPSTGAADPVLRVIGDYYVDWEVSGGRLTVTPDGDTDRQQSWPPFD
ncbi:lysozyme inhibitor LprI family protein [Pseudooceanicola sp. LIPI14-2-Ac024]|uniref:lysozyme inhibitor LprI family protein n=1 Tax=Pseudooceanicola sp. LIPI14-2-Ac024 TaxID=3344875 RepID=UPI0035D10684